MAEPRATVPARDGAAARMGRQHVRGSVLLVLGRVVAMILSLATQVLIVRVLTKADFGAFAYALALAAAARTALSLGQGRALSRFMASYDEQRDYPRMFGAMFLAVGTIFVTSFVGIGAMFAFRQELAGSTGGSEVMHLVLILVFLSPLEALDQVFVSLFAVFSAPRAIFVRKYVLAPGIRLVVVALLVITGSSVVFLAVGYVLGALAGVLIYVWLLLSALRQRGLLHELRRQGVVVPYRDVFAFSVPLITGEVALLSLTAGGVFVLALFHPTSSVADYRSVFGAARLNTAITASFATLFLPMIAKLHTRGDLAGLRESYWHTAAFVAVFTFPVFALTGPLAPATTVTLFGERYAASASVLSVLATGYYLNVMLGFNAYALQVCGRIRYLVVVNTLTAAGNIALCFLLAPRFAAVGAAVANALALVGQNLMNQAALRSSLRTGLISRSCWGCYGAIAGAAAALWTFELTISPGLSGSLAAAAVATIFVLLASRRALDLVGTFPEVARLPVLRWAVR